ncbi:cytochrome P450 2J4-like isoform X3 [Mobula hypostoma]|uniref:cytochrome P450 2J4-like isoform X3 n=1 Tax=Mobula hypostoma TaxID=723540 RepID=UPI002FC2A008
MEVQNLSFLNLFSREVWTVAVFLFVFLIVFDVLHTRVPKNFPPGPFGLPFFGNTFQLDLKNPHLQFCKFAEKYGDIFSLRIGYSYLVVINGLNAFKEAVVHQTDVFAGTAAFPVFDDIVKGHGIHFSDGNVWKEQRKFARMTLRRFGVGQKSLETQILEKIKDLQDAFKREKGQPFNPQTKIHTSILNVICSIVFGEQYDCDGTHADIQEFRLILDKVAKFLTNIWVQLYNSFPKLVRHLPGPHNDLFASWKSLEDLFQKNIKQHRERWNPTEQRDFIDCFLLQMQKAAPNSSFDDQNLLYTSLDLFFAGSETTATTLLWALLYMAGYPDIQEKVHDEIVSVIGQQDPVMDDRINLPYTNAVVHEIQRKGILVPFTLHRKTTRDTTVGKYFIPKGTQVIANLYSVLMDKSEWETPEEFNPEHFLNKDGKFVRKEAFVAFSGGKRNCMGEPLARMQLFLFFTSLMQKFKFVFPVGVKPSFEAVILKHQRVQELQHQVEDLQRYLQEQGTKPEDSLAFQKMAIEARLEGLSSNKNRSFSAQQRQVTSSQKAPTVAVAAAPPK